MANARCQHCHRTEAVWALQPWGPDAVPTLCFLGSHYRGFGVVKVCDECAEAFKSGHELVVTHKGQVHHLRME